MEKDIKAVVSKAIRKLQDGGEYQKRRAAILANFRNTIGKDLVEATNVWPFFFEQMPTEYLSINGKETFEERAVYSTLQLYALCMQGSSSKVLEDDGFKGSIGKSIRFGRTTENGEALDRRFNVLISSQTYEELIYHLRQLLKIAKSKNQITVNFPQLAEDLFWFQKGDHRRICFRWAQDYYTGVVNNTKEETTNE